MVLIILKCVKPKAAVMGLVLWIDKNAFARAFVERVYKKNKRPFYGLGEVTDFSYLVDDLKPQVIVLDEATALLNLSVFKQQYDSSLNMRETAFIIIDDKGALDFIKNKIGSIDRAIDPFTVHEKLEQIVSAN